MRKTLQQAYFDGYFLERAKKEKIVGMKGEGEGREGKLWVVFLIQILLIFGGYCNCSFWDIRLKIHRLLNFNMLFQFLLTKLSISELFSCSQKVDHVTNYCKRPTIETLDRKLKPHGWISRHWSVVSCSKMACDGSIQLSKPFSTTLQMTVCPSSLMLTSHTIQGGRAWYLSMAMRSSL